MLVAKTRNFSALILGANKMKTCFNLNFSLSCATWNRRASSTAKTDNNFCSLRVHNSQTETEESSEESSREQSQGCARTKPNSAQRCDCTRRRWLTRICRLSGKVFCLICAGKKISLLKLKWIIKIFLRLLVCLRKFKLPRKLFHSLLVFFYLWRNFR